MHEMKKFTFKGVLDGFRNSVANQQARADQEIVETLRPDNFQVAKVSFHIFSKQYCGMMPRNVSYLRVDRGCVVVVKTLMQ